MYTMLHSYRSFLGIFHEVLDYVNMLDDLSVDLYSVAAMKTLRVNDTHIQIAWIIKKV